MTLGSPVEQLRLRQQDLAWREVGEEIVLLDTRASLYASINESGRLLWLRLAQGATVQELAQAIVDAYGSDPVAAAADVEAFVNVLRSQDLLE